MVMNLLHMIRSHSPQRPTVAQMLGDVVGCVDELTQELLFPADRDVQPASTAPLGSRRLARLGAFERDVREVDVYVSGPVENEGCNETVPSKC